MEVAAISAAGNSTCAVYEITGTKHKVCVALMPARSLKYVPSF